MKDFTQKDLAAVVLQNQTLLHTNLEVLKLIAEKVGIQQPGILIEKIYDKQFKKLTDQLENS